MPRLPDRLLPSHLGAGLSASARTAAGARLSRRERAQSDAGSLAAPGRTRSAARAPRSQGPARTRAPPGGPGAASFPQGCAWTAPAGGAGRGGARAGASGHVTRANMAAPSGVHLLVRRGKHLRDSPAGLRGGVAPSPVTRVQRDPPSRSDVAAPTNVRSVLRLRAALAVTHGHAAGTGDPRVC